MARNSGEIWERNSCGAPHEESADDVGHVDGGLVGAHPPVEGEEKEGEDRLVEPAPEQVVHVGVVARGAGVQHDPHTPPHGVGVCLLRS